MNIDPNSGKQNNKSRRCLVFRRRDGGATYDELNEARLVDAPVVLRLENLVARWLEVPGFYAHPTFVGSDPVSGIAPLAQAGVWSMTPSMVEGHAPPATFDAPQPVYAWAELRSLSLFGVFTGNLAASPSALTGGTTTLGGGITDTTVTSLPVVGGGATTTLSGGASTTMEAANAPNGGGAAAASTGDVWVDFDYLGLENGSQIQPFNRFLEGVFFVPTGNTINLKPAASNEVFTVSKAMTITAIGGPARIGDASAIRDVTINEFVPTNLAGLQDEDATAQDWIEVFNAGTAPVSLNGWGLSNDAANPFKWTFPNVSLAPGAYLVVFASGKNRVPIDGSNLHTNFTLAPSADDMVLTTAGPDSITPTRINNYPAVADNNASAFFPQGLGGAFQETNNPTPGAANKESGGVVILDPGHGLNNAGDSATTGFSNAIGATGTQTDTPEFKGAFVVAEQVKGRIETLDPSITVIITKSSANASISNLDRARQLGDNGAPILVSLHFDGNSVGGAPRRTFAIALPELFQETIGGVVFKTNNRNQAAEIMFGQKLVDAVVAAFLIPGALPSQNGGVRTTGTSANKGVLFETTPDWVSNVGPGGEMWEERLYHTNPSTPTTARGIAVILEIDNYKNTEVDLWLNDLVTRLPTPSRYQPISDAIAQVIVDEVNK